jgi:hypothetical protein
MVGSPLTDMKVCCRSGCGKYWQMCWFHWRRSHQNGRGKACEKSLFNNNAANKKRKKSPKSLMTSGSLVSPTEGNNPKI